MFEIPAALLSWFYGWTDSYMIAIALIAAVVMAITTPLTLKSTKGMLEMQRLAPEMRKLQNEYRNDRTKLNEEMMKLYQEHKVNPMASCLPLLAQAPVFYIMFRILRGLAYEPSSGAARQVSDAVWGAFERPDEVADPGFIPRYLSVDSALYRSLFGEHEMLSLGLDLSKSAAVHVTEGFAGALPYILLVVLLGGLYFVQQRMVAARAAISPTMSAGQAKLMQYLPVFFAIFQIFFLAALVVYYIFQTLLRIAQQAYITRAFYGHDESLGRQAQRAGEAAREEAKKNGESGGLFAQAKRELSGGGSPKSDSGTSKASTSPTSKTTKPAKPAPSKRVTPPKSRPTPSAGAKGRPTPTRREAQELKAKSAKSAKSSRPKSTKKST
ncbi:MAG TPA: YidC/Oxa1 family membrane protein insertase [Ilumatobacteraceae bacterium]|jgi:YidC/Oxa1 family membrane protein insertase|nr:YidC/Oxa1 family membrane protein insertase [Ilumatobacteraceae bacterium]